MFVTFYSYKGGVGRSMALANVACLLAEDQEHPQKVLLWDFDLEAPGLHKLFPPAESFRRGFVDLAFEVAQHDKMPDPSDFVYHSQLDGVDVLPAGRVDESYCAQLERINWLGFFGDDPIDKGRFFTELTEWMRAAPQNYDYVLIDSRTGLNDVAGICTQVLPDLVLFIFRLTDQNLDGIEHLVPTIRSQLEGRDKAEVEIFPVASVVLSQSSSELNAKRKRAASVFKTESLSYIRFDPDLIADEKLFCRQDITASTWPVPSIVDDYERLCKSIRRKNEKDTQTSASLLDRAMREHDYTKARTALVPLLKRRPALARTWWHLRRLWSESREGMKWADKLFEDVQADTKDNVFVLDWMASKCAAEPATADDDSLAKARKYMERAIAIQPDLVTLHRKLAEIASAAGDLEHAAKALRTCHELKPDNVQILVDLANVYVRMGQDHFVDALKVLDQGDSDIQDSLEIYLWAFLGNEENAQRVYERCLENSSRFIDDWHYRQLIRAHLLLIQGKVESALQLAEECSESENQPPDGSAMTNWAEFFLCAEEFKKVQDLLIFKGTADPEDRHQLCTLADYLTGETGVNEGTVLGAWEDGFWSFTELVFFRERVKRLGKNSYGDRLDVIEKLIRKSAFSSYYTRNEGSVFWRRPSHEIMKLQK